MEQTLKTPFSVYVCKSSPDSTDESNISSFRFEIQDVPAWEDMKEMVKAQYDITQSVMLKHIDVEHEEITIGSEEEWRLAVKAAEKESNQLFLKLFVVPGEAEPATQRPGCHRGAKCKKSSIKSHIQSINDKVENLSKELTSVRLTQQQQNEELIRQTKFSKRVSDGDGSVPIMHEGIVCSACRKPIFGHRYKCVTCSEFNLCEKCEKIQGAERVHPKLHIFLKIVIPVDRGIDTLLARAPLIPCNLYERSSVERFMKIRDRFMKSLNGSRRRSRSSSSSSSSTGSSTSRSTELEFLRHEAKRLRRHRKRHGRSGSASTSTHDTRRRRKYRRFRSHSSSSSSSGSSSGSSSTGSSASGRRSLSPSLVRVERSSRRSHCSSDVCQYGRRHSGRSHRHHPHSHLHRRHNHDDGSSSRRHGKHHGHRHHRRLRRRSSDAERHRLLMDSSPLCDFGDRSGAAMELEHDVAVVPLVANAPPRPEGTQESMMTDQEMQLFRARLNRLVSSPPVQQPETQQQSTAATSNAQEYFVQTGCGLGDWMPVSERPTEPSDTIGAEFTLVDSAACVPEQRQQELQQAQKQAEEERRKELEEEERKRVEEEERRKREEEEQRRLREEEERRLREEEERRLREEEERRLREEEERRLKEEEQQKCLEEERRRREEEERQQQQPQQEQPQEQQQQEEDDVVITGVSGPSPDRPQEQQQQQQQETGETAERYPEVPYPQAQLPQYQFPSNVVYPPQPAPAPAPPVYPYPLVDGSAAANLWSAAVNHTTNVFQQMQSGWQGITAQEPRPAPEVRTYDYRSNREMQQLIDMGFCNREKNQRLLEKYKNDLSQVVAELINDTNDEWHANRH